MDKQKLLDRLAQYDSHIRNLQADIQKLQNDLNLKVSQNYAFLGAKEEISNLLKEMEEEIKPA